MAQVRPSSDDAPLPAQGVRTTISLLLFMHLFGLVLGLTAYASPSSLQMKLKVVFGAYLQTLNFDFYNSARLYLTHASPTDIDFTVEVTSKGADGQVATLTLPPADLFPPQRTRRYQSLANAAGSLATPPQPGEPIDEEMAAVLPKSIAASLLARQGATSGTVKIRAHYLVSVDDFESDVIARRDPFDAMRYATSYEAQVLLRPDGVDLLKTAAAGEVAPVEKGSK